MLNSHKFPSAILSFQSCILGNPGHVFSLLYTLCNVMPNTEHAYVHPIYSHTPYTMSLNSLCMKILKVSGWISWVDWSLHFWLFQVLWIEHENYDNSDNILTMNDCISNYHLHVRCIMSCVFKATMICMLVNKPVKSFLNSYLTCT